MSRPGFVSGALAAAGLAVLAGTTAGLLSPFTGFAAALKLAVPLVALGYLSYLIRAQRQRTGRVVTLTLWAALAGALWWADAPLVPTLMAHAGALWLVRALHAYSGVIPALTDLGLTAFAVLAGAWALARTGSVALATWTLFLVQALWVVIPPRLPGPATGTPNPDNRRFERARRQADEALRQLARGTEPHPDWRNHA